MKVLAFGSPLGNYSFPVLCADNIHRHRPLRVPTHTLVDWSPRDSFLVSREIYVRPVYDSNQVSLDLQSKALPLDQRGYIYELISIFFKCSHNVKRMTLQMNMTERLKEYCYLEMKRQESRFRFY